MDKKKLLAMSKLLATPQMKKLAIKDAAEAKTPPSYYRGAYRWNENSIGLFLRCRVEDGILMVSLFYPEYLRAGAKEPSYVVYVDRASRQFLTYGTERQKWFTGTVESLSWPAYIRSNSKFILTKKEQGIIKSYLGTEDDGYTLEIEPDGTVRQARTEFSRTDDEIEQIKAYLKEWQAAISGRLTKVDHKRAKKSKVLRTQEFEQMRKDNVQIRVGDLAGRRLVDVLMADLMEAA